MRRLLSPGSRGPQPSLHSGGVATRLRPSGIPGPCAVAGRVALAALLVVALPAIVASEPDPLPDSVAARIRAPSPVLARAVAAGYAHSPTFRAVADRIAWSNVIVHLDVADLGRLDGALRIAGTAGGQRYLRILMNRALRPRELIPALAHELQHAAEIALAPEVTDSETLVALFDRIGHQTKNGYETAAARRVTILVSAELGVAAEVSYVLQLMLTEEPEDIP